MGQETAGEQKSSNDSLNFNWGVTQYLNEHSGCTAPPLDI
jgi:hypothetical protein